jgi:hypothetical protein
MAYVTAALIQAEFKSLDVAAAAVITSAKVTEFIAQEEATLNGMVGTVYSCPVVEATSPLSFAIMKMLATLMIKARVEDILRVKTGGKTPDQGGEAENPNYKKAMELIKKITDREMLLPDGTLAVSSGGVRSYTAENEVEHTFERETESW